LDKTTLIGLFGQYLTGRSMGMIFQATAALIVFGGTLGTIPLLEFFSGARE